MKDERIGELVKQVKAGTLGKGLNLKRNLGDDFEEVMKACQSVPTEKKPPKKERESKPSTVLDEAPEE